MISKIIQAHGALFFMAKLPFMQFYPKDWLFDTRILTPLEKAVLIDLLCFMWDQPKRGEITGHPQDIGRMVGLEWQEARIVIDSLKTKNILTVTERDSEVTLISRRIKRDENARESHNDRQRRYRESKAKSVTVTPRSKKMTGIYHISEVIKDKDIPDSTKQESVASLESTRKPKDYAVITSLLTHYMQCLKDKLGGPAIINHGAGRGGLRRLIKELDSVELLKRMGFWFKSDDHFIQKRGYRIEDFCSNINALKDGPIMNNRPKEDTPAWEKQMMEKFKQKSNA